MQRAGAVWGCGAEPSCPPYLSIRSELELLFAGSPDWVCCFSCDLANFSAAAMGHPDKLWKLVEGFFVGEEKEIRKPGMRNEHKNLHFIHPELH